ncbi:MAG: SurA N-terminal domain-containing protein [Alphaproteobacteria bacterium]|nr:SurA N-terminal domain-containing protein [Alphaproteobacteria bacterium]
MINKLAKAQKSFIAKLILTLTALSFMSLFGITGYISNASSNRTVISVDNIKISQAAFSHAFQQQLNAAKNLLDIDFNDDANEEIRTSILNATAQKMVHDAVIDRTAEKHHVLFRPTLIRQMIMTEPAFTDMSGNFSKELFRRVLSENNISEEQYVQTVKRDLVEQLLLKSPVRSIKAPKTLVDLKARVDSKRRTFKYMLIRPDEIEIDRNISDAEIAQYYEDFAANFIEPERRDLSVLYISFDAIEKNTAVSSEEIKAYYDEHISEYETPEKRHVLQMMFENEAQANAAYDKLEKGVSFENVAHSDANQSAEDTDLGEVAQDELVFEIADDVFALNLNGYTKPVQTGEFWQIMKVVKIIAPTKQDYAVASKQIKKEIVFDRLYEEIDATINKIEDSLGEGKTLEQIAQNMNASIFKVQGLADDGSVHNVNMAIAPLLKNADFIDTAFLYAKGEISQTMDFNEGLAVLRVDDIIETHQKDIETVTPQIRKLWKDNEKAAVAQETLNDVMHDLENGDDLYKVAPRYGIHVYQSQPITRNETFEGISYADIRELFMQDLGTPYQTQVGDNYIIAVAYKDYRDTTPLDEAERNLIELKATQGLWLDLEKAMLDSYAKDYKIKIKYKLMGLIE